MVPGVAKVFVLAAIVLSTVISIATAQVPLMLRGTIESASNRTLAVKARDGMATKVMLADDAHVFLLKQASLADLKRGSLVGSTAIQQVGGGSQKAVEIYIFPDEPKREPNDAAGSIVGRENEILSYTEGSVINNADQVLTMKYPGGDKKITIPANVRVAILVPATMADIKVGQYFLAPNAKPFSLGTLASTIIVGSDRVDFAM